MSRGAAIRRLSNGAQMYREVSTSSGIEIDASGKFVRDIPLGSSLLHSLLKPAAVSTSQPVKRGRGRPRKVDVLAAKVWGDVTDGAGVVLVDGEPLEVPKVLK